VLELIAGGKKEKPDFVELYSNAMMRTLERQKEAPEDKQANLRAIFYGVKLIGVTDNRHLSAEGAYSRFWLIESIKASIGKLTPQELMQIFPVRKVYDGERWEVKDYFFTMDVLRQHGLDKPMGGAVDDLLWNYMNRDIGEFVVASIGAMDELRRHSGEQCLMKEFAEQKGMKLPMYIMTTDRKGRRWLTNDETGERQRVKVKRPKYLRAVSSI
jgi:hypothetical protein